MRDRKRKDRPPKRYAQRRAHGAVHVNTETGIIAGVSVSHATSSVGSIELASDTNQRDAVTALLDEDGVDEAFVLQTCNRAEGYVVASDEETGHEALEDYVSAVDSADVEWFDHEESIRHLLRVACGLESLVLGEDQILGQVRTAYEDARTCGGIGTTFDDAILKALHVGERVRAETQINEGVVSLGSAAVQLAETERELDGATAVVVGAGEMATLAARALEDRVGNVVIANRTKSHAAHVAADLDVDATAVGLDTLSSAVRDADVLVSATGSEEPVIDESVLEGVDDVFVVDLAQPRDVDPTVAARIDGVDVRDLDDLESIAYQTRRKRRKAAEAVEEIIDEEFDHLVTQYKRKRADRVIASMYEGAERMKSRELERAISRLEADGTLSDDQREVLESLVDSLVNQLLAAPTKSLRDAAESDDWSTINTALQLFDPDFHPDPASLPSLPDRFERASIDDRQVDVLGESHDG